MRIQIDKKIVVFRVNEKFQRRSLVTLDQLKCIKYDLHGYIHSKSHSFNFEINQVIIFNIGCLLFHAMIAYTYISVPS